MEILRNISLLLAIESDWGIFALRVAVGVVLFVHGFVKLRDIRGTGEWFGSVGFRPGLFWGTVAAVAETLGGTALLLGVGVRWTALILIGEFLVILGWRFGRRDKLIGGFELDLIILAALMALATLGGGAWALF